jgi:hypothetical protein
MKMQTKYITVIPQELTSPAQSEQNWIGEQLFSAPNFDYKETHTAGKDVEQ